MHQNLIRSHGGIIMNEISNLVKNYNSLIEDLGQLNQDIYEIVKDYNVEWKYEFWFPRDRAAWSLKKTFASKYQNKQEVFYVGFNLDDDYPYLLLERMYELKNCSPDDFTTDNDCFDHLLNSEIKKDIDENNIGAFECDWGKCIFAKISLLEITSQDIVNTDIKAVINFIFKKGKMSLKNIKLL